MAWLVLLLSACPGGEATSESDSDAASEVVTSILPPTTADDSTSSGGEPGTTTQDEPDPTTTASSTTGDGPLKCDDFIPAAPEPIVPRVVLVLDKSGSMLYEWDHDGDPATDVVSRWSSLHAVVESMVGGLDTVVQFGAVLFPSLAATAKPTIAACVVGADLLVPVGPQAGGAILAAIPPPNTTTIAGGTPSTAGLQAAISALDGLEGEEPRSIIFITDGAANCDPDNDKLFDDYDARLATTVADARDAGYQVHVVGIDISDALTPVLQDGNPDGINPYEQLNELAEIAGTARPGAEKFYNATNEEELQAALMAITGGVVSCEIGLGKPVPDHFYIQRVEIGDDADKQEYDGQDTQVDACDSESGWQYTSPTRDAIVLCGAACEHYKATGLVEIEYGCFIP
ncbi:vWA domain-containing protein [Nannocystis bainbridge]|uniref:VWA domain-containing protein n=1 Tax=Nannocystis bainbridge TaxID=2995303 RepID=A0ABT5EBL7_9BACT|nr:vWA domain-containing protein [Nannocystis bainbridge]MDC0722985.1 VWA domain-containing protein [Nannocystis bainbridge]